MKPRNEAEMYDIALEIRREDPTWQTWVRWQDHINVVLEKLVCKYVDNPG
jgi:hypothetical protein